MKHVKKLGLLVLAVSAFAVSGGTASATVVTAPSGTTYTSKIHASSEGHAILHNAFTTVECNSTAEGAIVSHGTSSTASTSSLTLHFTNCTGANTVTVFKGGTLEIHTGSNGHGTLTSSGAEVIVFNHTFGGTCIYTTSNTQIGTLTPAPSNTGHATLDIAGTIPRTSGTLGAFCGSTGSWTGSYKVNTPTGLRVS